ncbi:MAG: hypothetical protein IPG91_20575 [Ideonella sp.]|nr:hypothetical protein [Ideonella sp.]
MNDDPAVKSAAWRQRALIFAQRLWQPTSACMACMPGGWPKIWSAAHWGTALQTGLITGVLAVLLSFTPLGRLYGHRYGNAAMVGGMTALGDLISHPGHYGGAFGEALLTGAVSALLALTASVLLEDRGRRLRAVWKRLAG